MLTLILFKGISGFLFGGEKMPPFASGSFFGPICDRVNPFHCQTDSPPPQLHPLLHLRSEGNLDSCSLYRFLSSRLVTEFGFIHTLQKARMTRLFGNWCCVVMPWFRSGSNQWSRPLVESGRHHISALLPFDVARVWWARFQFSLKRRRAKKMKQSVCWRLV